MSEFCQPIEMAIKICKAKGHVMESGTIEVDGELWDYKMKKVQTKKGKR